LFSPILQIKTLTKIPKVCDKKNDFLKGGRGGEKNDFSRKLKNI